MRAALDAGARGDLEACLRHELSGAVVLESPRYAQLHDLLDLGDAAPAWAYSRWCLDLAYRTMLLDPVPLADHAVKMVLAALYPESLGRALGDLTAFRVLGTRVAAIDTVVEDVALFELGGLHDYLDHVAQPGLIGRADRIAEWADARMGVFAYRATRGCRLVLTDMRTGRDVEVLNIGAMSMVGEEHLVGRLVPISAEPGLMFASRPIPVDPATAEDIADAALDDELGSLTWLFALGLAVELDRAPEGFHVVGITPYSSDLPYLISSGDEPEEAPYIAELRAKGYSEDVAHAVGSIDVALLAAELSDQGAAAAGPHVTAALTIPGGFDAAIVECTAPETAKAWELLTAVVPEHVAPRCRELAERARSS